MRHNRTKEAGRCRKKFLYYFPKGFQDKKYQAWERNYKWEAHMKWKDDLNKEKYETLLQSKDYLEIANRAVKIETKTNLLFSFEKMALRDAVKSEDGAEEFANALYNYIYRDPLTEKSFMEFSTAIASLPRKQTRVHTWPLLTVFAFIAQPAKHIFLKPRVTQLAAANYNFPFSYHAKPNWKTYQSLLTFAEQVRNDNIDLKPLDYIDLQSFIWVNGSGEYD